MNTRLLISASVDNTHAVGVDDACMVRGLELGQMVGRSSSNFAAKLELTVLFN